MEDVPYGRILREGWLLILICAILGAAGAYGVTRLLPETYASTATLMLQVDSTEASLFERNQFSLARIRSYPELVDSPEVISGVRADLDLSTEEYSDRDIRRMVSAENTTDTVLLVVRADASTAHLSAEMATSAARHLSTLIESTENSDSEDRYEVNLALVLPAVEPLAPISPQVLAITGLGLILGLAVGGITAVYRTLTSRRVRTIGDVRRVSGLRVVGRLPRTPRRTRTDGAQAAAYAETVANVGILGGAGLECLVVLTASDEALNDHEVDGLSAAFTDAGRPTVVIETRGGRSAQAQTLSALLGLDPKAEAEDVGESNESEASAASAGPLPGCYAETEPLPEAVLEKRLPAAVGALRDDVDVVLIVADASAAAITRSLLGQHTAVLVAVRSGSTSASDLTALVTKLGFAGVRPLGILLTGTSPREVGFVTETWKAGDGVPAPGDEYVDA